MPAAAVIPAPVAYIKVVAVKKLVVEVLYGLSLHRHKPYIRLILQTLYLEQIRVFQAGASLNSPAWNNRKGRRATVGAWPLVMINRDSWGHSYLIVRGEIL